MAELAPDGATEILVRARAFGESRLVCGVHNLRAVEAGRTQRLDRSCAALHGEPAFRTDLEVAPRRGGGGAQGRPGARPGGLRRRGELTAEPY
jgi:acid phosphatase (class A)